MSENTFLQKYCNNVLHNVWLLLYPMLWDLIRKNQSCKVIVFKSGDFDLINHLEIDITTRLLLDRLLASHDTADADVKLFYNGVWVFYEVHLNTLWNAYQFTTLFWRMLRWSTLMLELMIAVKLSSLNISLTGKSYFSQLKYIPFPTCIPLDVETRQKVYFQESSWR